MRNAPIPLARIGADDSLMAAERRLLLARAEAWSHLGTPPRPRPRVCPWRLATLAIALLFFFGLAHVYTAAQDLARQLEKERTPNVRR